MAAEWHDLPRRTLVVGKRPRRHTHDAGRWTVDGGGRWRIKRLSPSALSASTPDVTARLVLTLSEATDLIEAQCQR